MALTDTRGIPIHPYSPVKEAHNDFYGFPSKPLSIYHTGPAWPLPLTWGIPKEARPICTHAIAPIWHELGKRIYTYFDSVELKWTSIDPVRFAEQHKEPGPLFLWVGVMPSTLSRGDAKDAAVRCKEILLEYEIHDVEIAFRESVFRRFNRRLGPQLLHHVDSFDPTADLVGPFTPALGLQIASKTFPYYEGTGCVYLCEGGESDRVFLLTTRHAVFPPSEYPNDFYHRKKNNIPWRPVIHLGSRAFQNTLEAIMDHIEGNHGMVDRFKDILEDLGEAVEGEPAKTTTSREMSEHRLADWKVSEARVNEFHANITRSWSAESQRILGHVVYAPAISVGTGDKPFAEDWALVELDRTKFDWDAFRGNVVHIRSTARLHPVDFMRKMYPDTETHAKMSYPGGSLMQLRDFVKDGELRSPTMLDKNGEECLIVVKNGAGTGVTLGRTTDIQAFIREYKDNVIQSTSMAIPIYSYSFEDGDFSGPGDSGAVIADANSRIVGMLVGGTGNIDFTDVTYALPYHFLDERIKEAFPNSYLYPISA
ncbi:hypothetical protein BDN72DRAFT_104242 [Pluteus cervinus]|uniref:Uncharacterized protein n=1 Tax=Pluteus cervinus TaxID=181527 RepID=A0ACD3B8C6_9AGAR|nr:hypothetical protein BDN72DRAFT_104242 [Pluteus cervinus]